MYIRNEASNAFIKIVNENIIFVFFNSFLHMLIVRKNKKYEQFLYSNSEKDTALKATECSIDPDSTPEISLARLFLRNL